MPSHRSCSRFAIAVVSAFFCLIGCGTIVTLDKSHSWGDGALAVVFVFLGLRGVSHAIDPAAADRLPRLSRVHVIACLVLAVSLLGMFIVGSRSGNPLLGMWFGAGMVGGLSVLIVSIIVEGVAISRRVIRWRRRNVDREK